MAENLERNKEVVRAYFAALNGGGGDPYALFEDNFSYNIMGHSRIAGTYVGREQLQRVLDGYYKNLNNLQLWVLKMVAEENCVTVFCKGDCTTHKQRAYNNDYVFLFRLRDGRITECNEYCDSILLESAIFNAHMQRVPGASKKEQSSG